jgi:hypothetical protein
MGGDFLELCHLLINIQTWDLQSLHSSFLVLTNERITNIFENLIKTEK